MRRGKWGLGCVPGSLFCTCGNAEELHVFAMKSINAREVSSGERPPFDSLVTTSLTAEDSNLNSTEEPDILERNEMIKMSTP